ncbi:MAG: hypothetical protein JRJ85_05350 [Deltaproteobacteria bacterium]|nr:hypothetical protein [Deltaproteobacteria bacterium]
MKPGDQVEGFFEAAARAVVSAQSRLDRMAEEGYRTVCAIPRVHVNAEFGIAFAETIRLLWVIPKGGRKDRHIHRLSFSLVSVDDPPVFDAPGPSGSVPVHVTELDFMVPPHEEGRLYDLLIRTMRSEIGEWHVVPPSGSAELPTGAFRKKVRKEADRIQKLVKGDRIRHALASGEPGDPIESGRLRAELEALGNPDPERGMVCFRLSVAAEAYLIVRVTEKSSRDGIFLLWPGARPVVSIYSLEDDGIEEVRYGPLHRLVLAIRRRKKFRSILPGPGRLHMLGLTKVDYFTRKLRDGYLAAMQVLSENARDVLQRQERRVFGYVYPSYFDLEDVSADLKYSVEFDPSGKPGFNFQDRLAPDGSIPRSEHQLIQNRVRIAALRANGSVRVEVDFLSPEFVLTGSALSRFLQCVNISAPAIASELGTEEGLKAEVYEHFLRDPTLSNRVVVMLSYKGKRPTEDFLVFWPVMWDGRARDFVFTCRMRDEKIRVLEVIMRLDEAVRDVSIQAPSGLSEKQYKPFHNFFHAVRIWRMRTVSPPTG